MADISQLAPSLAADGIESILSLTVADAARELQVDPDQLVDALLQEGKKLLAKVGGTDRPFSIPSGFTPLMAGIGDDPDEAAPVSGAPPTPGEGHGTKAVDSKKAFSFYDLDGTCTPDTSTSFLLYAARHRPAELLKIARGIRVADVIGIPLILYRYNTLNSVTNSEGEALLGRISGGFQIDMFSEEWAAKKGAYEIYEFTLREWAADLAAGRDIVIISSQAQSVIARLMEIVGVKRENIIIVDGEETGATKRFQDVPTRFERNGRVSETPKVYILGSKFGVDADGNITDFREWNHGKTKLEVVHRFVEWLKQQGIQVDRSKSKAYYDKAFDEKWADEIVPKEHQTVVNPKGKGSQQFVDRSLKEGRRVVQVNTEVGDTIRRGDKLYRVTPEGVEEEIQDIKTVIQQRKKEGKKTVIARDTETLQPQRMTDAQAFAGVVVSPVQWFWGDLASDWMMGSPITWARFKGSAKSYGVLTGVGAGTEITVRGGINLYNKLPFMYAGPKVRFNPVARMAGMFAGMLALEKSTTGDWNYGKAFEGALVAGGLDALLTYGLRGALTLCRVPKGWVSAITLPFEILVAPPLEFYALKKWGLMTYRWSMAAERSAAIFEINEIRAKRREAMQMALAASLMGNESDAMTWNQKIESYSQQLEASWKSLIEVTYASVIGPEELEYQYDRQHLVEENPTDFDPVQKAEETMNKNYTLGFSFSKDGVSEKAHVSPEEYAEIKKGLIAEYQTQLATNQKLMADCEANWETRKADLVASFDASTVDPDAVAPIPVLKMEDYDSPAMALPKSPLDSLINPPFSQIPKMASQYKLAAAAGDSHLTSHFSENPRELIAQRIRMEIDDMNEFMSVAAPFIDPNTGEILPGLAG